MANKIRKKSGFMLAPITLSEPIKATDGFTNLVESALEKEKKIGPQTKRSEESFEIKNHEIKREVEEKPNRKENRGSRMDLENERSEKTVENFESSSDFSLSIAELLRLLEADSLDEIYELTDVLRASSLKLYATLVQLADSRGRARVKNHELMSKAGIKGIATLYKQERWLMDLKLLEKKAKPGPHDGSSYVVYNLETLPLPAEIFEKFNDYLSDFKQQYLRQN